MTDVAGDDSEFRKFQGDVLEVGNRAARLGWQEGTGMADLQAEGNAELDTLGLQGIVAAIVRRKIPQPGNDSEPTKPQFPHATAEFPDPVHGPREINRGDACESIRMTANALRDFVVRDHRPGGAPPGGEQAQSHTGFIHDAQGVLQGRTRKLGAAGPPAK